jgi:hypothetical protein
MDDALGTRAALGEGTTHVIHFGHYCGATRLDRFRGRGLWILMTADDYAQGREDNESDDWTADAPKGTPVRNLASWVAARVGYPVTLTRSDDLIAPDWTSLAAYRVRRSTS